jgi:hypothetical protein
MDRESLEKLAKDRAKSRQVEAERKEQVAQERREDERQKDDLDYELAQTAYATVKTLFAGFRLPDSGHELQIGSPPGRGKFKGFPIGITHCEYETGDYPGLIGLFGVYVEDGALVLMWGQENAKEQARFETVESLVEKAAEIIADIGLDYLKERFACIKQQRNRGRVFVG